MRVQSAQFFRNKPADKVLRPGILAVAVRWSPFRREIGKESSRSPGEIRY